MKVGDQASTTRRFDRVTIDDHLALSGAMGAATDRVPEPLIGGLFSYLLGVELPGSGTNYLKQELRFHRPAPLDQVLTATVTITRFRPDKHLCDLTTICTDENGAVICDGRALVRIKDVAKPIEI